MKFIKQTVSITLFLVIAGILCRGWIYRTMVTYKTPGQRQSYTVSDKKLIEHIEKNSVTEKDLDVKDIIKFSLSITSRHLVFTADKNDRGIS